MNNNKLLCCLIVYFIIVWIGFLISITMGNFQTSTKLWWGGIAIATTIMAIISSIEDGWLSVGKWLWSVFPWQIWGMMLVIAAGGILLALSYNNMIPASQNAGIDNIDIGTLGQTIATVGISAIIFWPRKAPKKK
jgi:septal ring factor EnvC (AmiA/AmiB activator)